MKARKDIGIHLVDKYFPKKNSKERHAALFLYTDMIMRFMCKPKKEK